MFGVHFVRGSVFVRIFLFWWTTFFIFFNRCQDDIDTKSVSRCFMVVYHCGVSVRITNGCEMNGKVKAISPIK